MLIHSPRELALFIATHRKKLKLNQIEVSNLVGLRQKTISALENKPESIQLNTLFRVLSALGLDIQLSEKSKTTRKTEWKEEW